MRAIPGAVLGSTLGFTTSQALTYYANLLALQTVTVGVLVMQYAPLLDLTMYATEGAVAGKDILNVNWYIYGVAAGSGSTRRLWRTDIVKDALLLTLAGVRVPNYLLSVDIVEINGGATTTMEFKAISRNM